MMRQPTKQDQENPSRRIVLPGLAFILRREPPEDRTYNPQRNETLPVKVSPELAPKPIDDTAFYGVGRGPKTAIARATVYDTLAIQDITSHMNPWFLVPKVPSAMVVGSPRGAMLPVAGRPNIERRDQTTYGALATLRPGLSYGSSYLKIMGG